MASTISHDCTLCKEDNITNHASTWCTECESFLCNDCSRCHTKIKSLKHHKTVTVEEYNKVPKFIVDIKVRCEEHDEKYELYCPFHDSACCLHCITEKHNQCQNLKKLAEVLTDVKSSASVSHLEDNLKCLKSNLEEVLNYLKERIDILQQSKLSGIEEIKTVRKSLNEHLDMLEKQMLDTLESKHCELDSSIKKLKCEVEEGTNRVQQMQEEFSQIKQHATDIQTYVGHMNIQKRAASETKYIDSIESRNEMKEENLDIKINDNIRSILSTIKSFGSVTLLPSKESFKFRQNLEVNVQQHINREVTIDDINPVLKCTIKYIPDGNERLEISGCQIMPGGQLLIVDQNNKCLMLFNSEGKFIRKITTFRLFPIDLCFVKENIVVVTCTEYIGLGKYESEVVMVDIDKNEQIKTIKLESRGYGIDSDGENIMVRMIELEVVLVMDIDGNELYRVKIPGIRCTRIAMFEDKIYCTNRTDNTINCYRNEQLIWKRKLEDESITDPFSISCDGYDIVYATCLTSKKVITLSPNGTDMKVILSNEEMLKDPNVLHVDKKQGLIFVCDKSNGHAFLYKI